MGFLFLLSLLVVNSLVLSLIFGELNDYYLNNVGRVQMLLGITGCIYILLGFLSYKQGFLQKLLPTSSKGQNLVSFLIVLVSGILFIEYGLRIRPAITTAELYEASVKYEGSIFSRHKLPAEDHQIPFPFLETVNYDLHNGYHSAEFSRIKPDEETRIVILGGSFVFGDHQKLTREEMMAGYDCNWISKVERKLHEAGHDNIRVINAGIPGHATFDSFGRLYSEIHLFDPDFVVLCHGWNDIKYFSDVSPEYSLLRRFKPKAMVTKEDVSDIMETSQIYLRLKQLLQFTGSGLEGEIVEEKESSITPEAKKQFELTTRLFVEACKAINATPILLTQPRLIHENNTESERAKIAYGFQSLDHDGICEAFAFIDSTFLNYPSNDSTVIAHDFGSKFTGNDSLFTDQVHLNSAGNEALSTYLSKYFEDLIEK